MDERERGDDAVDRMIAQWSRSAPGTDVAALRVVGRLLQAAGALQRDIAAALRPLDLSYADFDVLATLRRLADPDGTHPRVLADSVLITSGAMTARLDRLERAGLTARRPDPADRRAVLVQLTSTGRALTDRALTAVLAADEEFLAPLDDPARHLLATTLAALLAEPAAGSAGSTQTGSSANDA